MYIYGISSNTYTPNASFGNKANKTLKSFARTNSGHRRTEVTKILKRLDFELEKLDKGVSDCQFIGPKGERIYLPNPKDDLIHRGTMNEIKGKLRSWGYLQ